MCWHRQEVTHRRRALMYPTSTTRNECSYFRDGIWLTTQGLWMAVMKMKVYGIATDEFWLNDFSWTCRRQWNELVALTQNKVMDGMIDQWCDNHQAEWPNPHNHSDEVKVSCSRATCYHKIFSTFSNFPQSFLTSTSLFFIKLEEDNICLLYNSTLWVNPSLCDVLMSLAKVKLGLVAIDKFVAIWCFNEFNDKDNSALFMFKEFEKEQK